jgi:probable rRNA maturation factor
LTLLFSNEIDADFGFNLEETAHLVIDGALNYEKFPYECEISLTIVDSKTIKELNNEFRKIDKPTDVLSFPMLEFNAPGDFSDVGDDPDTISPESGEIMLGDIVLCKEKILSQAEEYGHSVRREYSFLIAHSMLHLMGYDHIDDDERMVMEKKQEEILQNVNITRTVED